MKVIPNFLHGLFYEFYANEVKACSIPHIDWLSIRDLIEYIET